MRCFLFPALLVLASCGSQTERWTSSKLDGHPAAGFMLALRGGQIIGGHDGCNGWGLSDHPGMIVTDLQECPPDPRRDAYWALARDKQVTFERKSNRLLLRGGGHSGIFLKQ